MFSNKVVLVTGAAGGLGSAVCHFFKKMDAKVIVVDLKLSLLETVFGSNKEDFFLFSVDLTERDQTRSVFERILIDHDRIDIVCNIAGGFSMGEPVHEMSDSKWDFLFDLNLKSILHTSSVLVPNMIKNGGGKIINVGASVNWHKLVNICIEKNIYGFENLSLIPGTVGAAPIQNIGAVSYTHLTLPTNREV